MDFVKGITVGGVLIAIVAALAHDFPEIGFATKLPEWGQTIGTIIAVFVAVWIAHKDRLDARADALNDEITQRRRLIAAIRVELSAIMSMAETHRSSSAMTLKSIIEARKQGKIISNARPIRTITFGDKQIYKAVAQRIGILPEALVAQIVSYYSYIYNVEDLAASSVSVEEMLVNVTEHFPRILVGGEILIEQLIMYENVGCGQVANLSVPIEKLQSYAEKHGYPLTAALKAFAYR